MARESSVFADPEGGGGIGEIVGWDISERVAEVAVSIEDFGVGLKKK